MSTGTSGISHQRLIEEARKLTTEVVKLKEDEGISFTAIAVTLTKRYGKSIPVSRVQRRYKEYVKRKREGKPEVPAPGTQPEQPVGTAPYYNADFNEVPILERKFGKKLIEGMPATDAARSLGINNPSRWQHEVKKRPAFQQYFRQQCEANGLTEGYVAKVHRELLDAKRTIYAVKDGKITDTLEVPDNSARMNAVKSALEMWKLTGSNQVEEHEEAASATIIVLTAEKRTAIEGLIGKPLDCEIVDDAVNFAAGVGAGAKKQTENSADEAGPSQSSSADANPEVPSDG